jgi:hypothetical protein
MADLASKIWFVAKFVISNMEMFVGYIYYQI